MAKKKVWTFFLSLLLLTTLSGCNFFKSWYELHEITGNLHAALAEEYGIHLPDTAVFAQGYMDVGLRDPHVQLIMRIPQSDFSGMMDEKWVKEDAVTTTIEGVSSESAYWREGDNRNAELFITAPDDSGIISVLFYGDNPTVKWLDD